MGNGELKWMNFDIYTTQYSKLIYLIYINDPLTAHFIIGTKPTYLYTVPLDLYTYNHTIHYKALHFTDNPD